MAITPLKKPNDQDLKIAIIANSQTLTNGDMIIPGTGASSTFVSPAASGSALLLGNMYAIQGKAGTVLELNSLAAASDNQTNAQNQAVYLPSYIPTEFECDINAAAGTTTGSGGVGFFTLTSAGTLNESTWVAFSGTASHFVSFGVTPYSTTKVFGHVYKTL